MVENAEDIKLEFGGVPSGKTVNAKWIWDKLVQNAYESGQPGVLNGYLANQMNDLSLLQVSRLHQSVGEIWWLK